MSPEDLVKKMNRMWEERGWQAFHSPKNMAMSLSVETAELMEHFLWLECDASKTPDPASMEAIKDEIGDVMINILGLSNQLGIDPLKAAAEKLDKIAKRYPTTKE